MIPINENNIDYNIKISLYYLNDMNIRATINGNLTFTEVSEQFDEDSIVFIYFKLNNYEFYISSRSQNDWRVNIKLFDTQQYYTLTEQERNFIIFERKNIQEEDYHRLFNIQDECREDFELVIDELDIDELNARHDF